MSVEHILENLEKYGFAIVPNNITNLTNEIYSNFINIFNVESESYGIFNRNTGLGHYLHYLRGESDMENKESYTYRKDEMNDNILLHDEYISKVRNLATSLLQLIKTKYNLNYNFDNTLNTLCLVNYLPNNRDFNVGFRSHTDWGFVTYVSTTNKGLEILNDNNEYIPIDVPPDFYIIFAGDMMENITNHLY